MFHLKNIRLMIFFYLNKKESYKNLKEEKKMNGQSYLQIRSLCSLIKVWDFFKKKLIMFYFN